MYITKLNISGDILINFITDIGNFYSIVKKKNFNILKLSKFIKIYDKIYPISEIKSDMIVDLGKKIKLELNGDIIEILEL